MKNKIALNFLLGLVFLCAIFFGCTDNNVDKQEEFRLTNAYSFESEFKYFDTPYKYTAYSFMLNYVYTGDEACKSYGFEVANKNGEVIDIPAIFVNGVETSTSKRTYLVKGSTISTFIGITSSMLPMMNTADSYDEFTVELYVELNDTRTILAYAEFTFEQVKQMCLPK